MPTITFKMDGKKEINVYYEAVEKQKTGNIKLVIYVHPHSRYKGRTDYINWDIKGAVVRSSYEQITIPSTGVETIEHTHSNLPVGTYTVVVWDILGFYKKVSRIVDIREGTTTSVTIDLYPV